MPDGLIPILSVGSSDVPLIGYLVLPSFFTLVPETGKACYRSAMAD